MWLSRFYLVLFGLLFMSCDNDDQPHARIPSVVLNEFGTRYPLAKDVEFSHVNGNYEVEFEIEGKDAKALFDPEGRLVKEKMEISWNQLPQPVQQALNTYGQNKVNDPEIINVAGDTFYQVKIRQFFFNKKLVFNKLGEDDTPGEYWN